MHCITNSLLWEANRLTRCCPGVIMQSNTATRTRSQHAGAGMQWQGKETGCIANRHGVRLAN